MSAFDCKGWLHVTVEDGIPDVLVKIHHNDDHAPYSDIDVPPDVRRYIVSNSKMTVAQVCRAHKIVEIRS